MSFKEFLNEEEKIMVKSPGYPAAGQTVTSKKIVGKITVVIVKNAGAFSLLITDIPLADADIYKNDNVRMSGTTGTRKATTMFKNAVSALENGNTDINTVIKDAIQSIK
jgi:hypothetical protein